MRTDQFSNTNTDVVLSPRKGLIIQKDEHGNIVLIQEKNWETDDDTIITISAEDIEAVITRLLLFRQ